DTRQRVGNQLARQSLEVVLLAFLAGTRVQRAVDQLEPDAGREPLRKRALRALHLDQAVLDRDAHALRHRDRLLTNTRHESDTSVERSEERRVGKEWCARRWPHQYRKEK